MDHLEVNGAGNYDLGFDVGNALARGSVRIVRERFATETLDERGRPTRLLRERVVIEGSPPRWNVVVAPSAYHSLPTGVGAPSVFLNAFL